MAKTYAQIQAQIEALSREAEQLKRDEIEGVIARIKEAVQAYGLTPADLGFGKAKASAGAKKKRPGRRAAAKTPAAAVVKFRDEAGNSWVGRGARPQWLRTALASGRKLEDFAV